MSAPKALVFLLDRDNALLDNDRVIGDLVNYDCSALIRRAGAT